jgi:DNA polymerase
MIIGEAPGAEEDRQGIPFVGRSGKLLNELLASIALDRHQVFITNTVKCRPEHNRTPSPDEVATCKKLWLEKQMNCVNPAIIVLLGNVALQSVLGRTGVTALHGKIIRKEGITYFITFHPSAALRFVKIKELMKEDFKKLKEVTHGEQSQHRLDSFVS